jgi:cobalt-zinc-cadmium efflux system outer membrane protein
MEVPALEAVASRLGEHPAVAAARAGIEVERARLRLAEAEAIPDVSLELLYRRIGVEDEHAVDVGVTVGLPLFDRRDGRRREAASEVAAAEARSSFVRGEALTRLRVAHGALVAALGRARVLREQIVPRAERLRETAEKRYAAGDASLVEALPLRREAAEARLAQLEAVRDAAEAWAGLSELVK